ncbi:MAG: response regulator [Candidatus Hydrogenedentes bacterium]|nr:response regulator [Candidatus Hydrogenedentota bacterium]
MSFNVLVVDDSATVRAIIVKTMRIANGNVSEIFEAGHGEEALQVLQEKWVDLVLTDINMPVMIGVELIKHMQANDAMKGIPVVVVSTEGSSTRMNELEAMGVRAYIRKPFTPEKMSEVVEQLLGAADERPS